MKMTWLHMQFISIFVSANSQAKLGITAPNCLLTLASLLFAIKQAIFTIYFLLWAVLLKSSFPLSTSNLDTLPPFNSNSSSIVGEKALWSAIYPLLWLYCNSAKFIWVHQVGYSMCRLKFETQCQSYPGLHMHQSKVVKEVKILGPS